MTQADNENMLQGSIKWVGVVEKKGPHVLAEYKFHMIGAMVASVSPQLGGLREGFLVRISVVQRHLKLALQLSPLQLGQSVLRRITKLNLGAHVLRSQGGQGPGLE